jgi:hypothetical protein
MPSHGHRGRRDTVEGWLFDLQAVCRPRNSRGLPLARRPAALRGRSGDSTWGWPRRRRVEERQSERSSTHTPHSPRERDTACLPSHHHEHRCIRCVHYACYSHGARSDARVFAPLFTPDRREPERRFEVLPVFLVQPSRLQDFVVC